ncbi:MULTISPECIES: hypothetical protein [Glycomyces]|uniref:Uncharacterized protein n=2 Tax=Glycomyces TaxID=58113 RepID=A0A9X3SYT8_9ACTN|nr:hypothetical protein [Glycomyces lechevalierae]MDA1386671.1 hypothetical protein [Glycomyces lechevalierae]MDR7340739.1 hypothetical protein [Glycomyces lechevalierae]
MLPGFPATGGDRRQAQDGQPEQLNLRPGRDKSATEGIGAPTDIPEHLVAMRDYGYKALRMSASVGEKVIGHLPLPE